jgi:hypothetical protein
MSELLGFWTFSIVRYSRKLENTTFRKLNLFPSSGEKGGYTYSVGPLRKCVPSNNCDRLTELHTANITVTTAHIKSSQSSLAVVW